MLDQCSDRCGWIAGVVAALSFGSFGVPIKFISNVKVDPLVMQSYKSFICFLTCWLVIPLGEPFKFTPWGIVSGIFWVPGATAGIYGIRNAGLAISVGTWSSLIVMSSFVWGIFVFGESVKSVHGASAAAVVLVIGLVGMSVYSAPVGTRSDGSKGKGKVKGKGRNLSRIHSHSDKQKQKQKHDGIIMDGKITKEKDDSDDDDVTAAEEDNIEMQPLLAMSGSADARGHISTTTTTSSPNRNQNHNQSPTKKRKDHLKFGDEEKATSGVGGGSGSNHPTPGRIIRRTVAKNGEVDDTSTTSSTAITTNANHLHHHPSHGTNPDLLLMTSTSGDSMTMSMTIDSHSHSHSHMHTAILPNDDENKKKEDDYEYDYEYAYDKKYGDNSSGKTKEEIVSLFHGRIRMTRRQLGILGAVINGVWGSNSMIPMHYARKQGFYGAGYLISYSCGSMLITILMWMCRYAHNLYLLDGNRLDAYYALPSFHVREMWLVGVLSGSMYSLGNFCSIIAVTALGQGVGYSFTQTSMLISGLWGIFFFKEVQGAGRISKWIISSIITICGILWLSYEHVGTSAH